MLYLIYKLGYNYLEIKNRPTNSWRDIMRAFNVYLNGKKIDTVFYSDVMDIDEDEVYNSLVYHDGYNPGIYVEEDLD